jgi:hypothetical protein
MLFILIRDAPRQFCQYKLIEIVLLYVFNVLKKYHFNNFSNMATL